MSREEEEGKDNNEEEDEDRDEWSMSDDNYQWVMMNEGSNEYWGVWGVIQQLTYYSWRTQWAVSRYHFSEWGLFWN